MFEIIDGQLTYRTNEETSLPVVLVTEPQVMPLTPAKTPSTKPMMGWLIKLTRRGLSKKVGCWSVRLWWFSFGFWGLSPLGSGNRDPCDAWTHDADSRLSNRISGFSS